MRPGSIVFETLDGGGVKARVLALSEAAGIVLVRLIERPCDPILAPWGLMILFRPESLTVVTP